MFIAKLLTVVRDWSEVRRSVCVLCAFSDRDLSDIGLTRIEDGVRARRDRRLG